MSEEQRIAFVEDRDGIAGAVDFAIRTMKIYRRSVLYSRKRVKGNPHHASLPEYRRLFIESYLALKRYIAAHPNV